MSDRPAARMFDLADEEVTPYRGLSSLAVLGLLIGLAAPAAMFGSIFWLVPVAAVIISGLALRQIAAQAPNLVGRPAAMSGLFLGVVFLIAAPVDESVYRYYLRREARAFAATWIDAVQHREIYKAHHLTIDPKRRLSLDEPLVEFYAKSDSYRSLLRVFLNQPVMRTLFALGTDDQIRFYETAAEGPQEGGDFVQSTYAVTYKDADGRPTTFFIALLMSRVVDRNTGRRDWTMSHVDGGVKPSGF